MTTLYLKYRPQKISDLDLAEVRDFLSRIVNLEEIPHAFLFEGPRGSGKTSAARIMAKILNCEKLSNDKEPCNKCEQCISITKGTNIDVVELDAASHRGIDDVRLIRESVKLSPAKAKKKVYIIDEAHMLTTEASNALLKTLEEPPGHVVFILATTNPEKLLDTIKSRTVRVNFKKAKSEEIIRSLASVLKKEKMKYQDEVLSLISENVDGSFRDAKKILEEFIMKDILNDIEKAQDHLLSKSDFDADQLFKYLKEKDLKNCVSVFNGSESAGVPAKTVYTRLINKIKDYLFSVSDYKIDPSNTFDKNEILALSDIFITFWDRYQNDISDYVPFYLASAKWCDKESDLNSKNTNSKNNKNEGNVNNINNSGGKSDLKSRKNAKSVDAIDISNNGDDLKEDNGEQIGGISKDIYDEGENISQDIWKQILVMTRNKNASTEALLRAARPANFDGKTLTLGVFYKFHKEKLESIPHKVCLEDVLRETLKTDVRVECFLTQPEVVKTELDTVIKDDLQGDRIHSLGGAGVILTESNDSTDIMKLVDEVFGS